MPDKSKKPLAEINIQKPGKITSIEEIQFKKVQEIKMKKIKTLIAFTGEKRK